MKKFIFLIFFTIISSSLIFSVYHISEILFDNEENEEAETKPTDWLYAQRAYPSGIINHEIYLDALHQAQNLRNQSNILRGGAANWTFAGPSNTGGRITSLAIHPSDAQTIYIGAAAGGIFKTTDGGFSWLPVFDSNSSLAIGDVAVATSNKNVLYVGTGEANGGGGSVSFDGLGVFKSLDAGATWQNMGLEKVGSIGKIAIDPQNPNRAFVGAMGYLYEKSPDRGVFRTLNGGQTWQKVLFQTDSTGCIDIALNPQNPNIIYAALWERMRYPNSRNYGGATCGIYRSKDGGDTWEKLTTGLPSSDIGRIGLAISPADPSVIYGIYTDVIGYFKGVFKTSDGGNSWSRFDTGGHLNGMFSSFGWWFGKIMADPIDINTVYALGLDIFKTSDGGTNWIPISNSIHVDQHALWINPNNPNQIYAGNDGGFYTSDNGASSWNFKDNLPITQFYTCEIDFKNPHRLYGGTQDNGTWRTVTGATNDWTHIAGGDGFVCLVDPTDNKYVYASSQNGSFYRSTDGGSNFQSGLQGINLSEPRNWKTPVMLSPNNPNTLYYGSNRIYRSTDRANSWVAISPDLSKGSGNGNLAYGTLTALAVSPKNAQIIYGGTDDGNAWVTSDGGTNWTKINNGLPNRWVTSIAADPFDENTAYITFSGYKWREYQPHVLKTTNKGTTWTDISSNLPQAPVNDFIIDSSFNTNNQRAFYAATDFGVYVSYNSGGTWAVLGTGLPLVSVMDMVLHDSSRTLVAATHGRSMYRIALPNAVPTVSISGSIKREKGDTISAQISLFNTINNGLFKTLNASLFNFNDLNANQTYEIKPYRNDNPVRGVTSFDIALITRHLLGITPLSTPYKIIAADVNNDKEIDVEDILLMRRLILRQIDTFPNNTSWRFIPKNYVFIDNSTPFASPFPESLLYNGLNENIINADFYALKVGDVNESANLFVKPNVDSVVKKNNQVSNGY
jgi:photosystem II stability/assembly factor-like uncharacterized protein